MEKAILKIKLTNFIGAFLSEIENAEGNIEECVCIPLNRNNLKKTSNNSVNAYCFVNETKVPLDNNWTHYVQMKASMDFLKKLNSEGYKLPYLGNIRTQESEFYKEKKKKYVKTKLNDDE